MIVKATPEIATAAAEGQADIPRKELEFHVVKLLPLETAGQRAALGVNHSFKIPSNWVFRFAVAVAEPLSTIIDTLSDPNKPQEARVVPHLFFEEDAGWKQETPGASGGLREIGPGDPLYAPPAEVDIHIVIVPAVQKVAVPKDAITIFWGIFLMPREMHPMYLCGYPVAIYQVIDAKEAVGGSSRIGKPRCDEHPASGVSSARVPGEGRRVWCCLTCGKRLGPAPAEPDDATWEET